MDFLNKKNTDLSDSELFGIHLYYDEICVVLKDSRVKSTLAFLHSNIIHSLTNTVYGYHLSPFISMCSILEQLGKCYNVIGETEPSYNNNLKRCLAYFSKLPSDDQIYPTLVGFRNGLVHNGSLVGSTKHKGRVYNYFFRYDKTSPTVIRAAAKEWTGDYRDLNRPGNEFVTWINPDRLWDLVVSILEFANSLNNQNKLILRLENGNMELYWNYLMVAPLVKSSLF